jgi:hypothetical protein
MSHAAFRWARVMGMTLMAVLVGVTVMSSMAAAQAAAPSPYADIAGRWAGYVTWPNGTSSETVWTFNPDGTFSIQTDSYTANGALKAQGTGYAFSYERNGEIFKGTFATRGPKGQMKLVGSGETPTGPMNIALSR